MEIIVWILVAIGTLLTSIWIVEWLFVRLMLGVMYVIYLTITYIPKALKIYFEMAKTHDETMLKAHDNFTENLETITTKFIWSVDQITREHKQQSDKLADIHRDQANWFEDICKEIKKLKS